MENQIIEIQEEAALWVSENVLRLPDNVGELVGMLTEWALYKGAKQISDEVKICTGCGRLSSDPPIQLPAIACCPDCHYLPIRRYWSLSCYPSSEYLKRT